MRWISPGEGDSYGREHRYGVVSGLGPPGMTWGRPSKIYFEVALPRQQLR